MKRNLVIFFAIFCLYGLSATKPVSFEERAYKRQRAVTQEVTPKWVDVVVPDKTCYCMTVYYSETDAFSLLILASVKAFCESFQKDNPDQEIVFLPICSTQESEDKQALGLLVCSYNGKEILREKVNPASMARSERVKEKFMRLFSQHQEVKVVEKSATLSDIIVVRSPEDLALANYLRRD